MDGSEYKNIRNVFEHWSEATMARRAKAEIALPTVWQCPTERQWLCPLAG
jgi:hypothetical protein